MTSKEAFERVTKHCRSTALGLGISPYNMYVNSIDHCNEDLSIIAQDLIRLEELEKVATEQAGLNIVDSLIKKSDKYKQENLKLKNAIEVLKKELCFEFYEPSKPLDFYAINLKLYKDDDNYTTIILDSDEKDEFFALKEVLDNDK